MHGKMPENFLSTTVLKQYKNMTGCVWSIFSEKQIKYEYLKYFKKYTKSLGDT